MCYSILTLISEIEISLQYFILLVTVNSDTIKEDYYSQYLTTVKATHRTKVAITHSFWRLNSPEILCVSLTPILTIRL
jgi:hypothetical protein